MRKYVKNHGIIFDGPQNFVGFSTGAWTGKGWETLVYTITAIVVTYECPYVRVFRNDYMH
jgi:hypothetical protein